MTSNQRGQVGMGWPANPVHIMERKHQMKKLQTKPILAILILCGLIALLVIPLGAAAKGSGMLSDGLAANQPVTGTYVGSVTVSEPAPLGALDLVLTVTEQGGVLSGKVNAAKTQVFLGGPTFIGTVSAGQGITTTFRIDSEIFTSQVSGRSVQRKFTLIGEVASSADLLRGQYTETIIGFTPETLLVKGDFLLARPSGSQVIIEEPGPNTPTPIITITPPGPVTPTATATRPGNPGGGTNSLLYLPVVMDRAGAGASSVEPVATPTMTPAPTTN
jgi:hypothetical protein